MEGFTPLRNQIVFQFEDEVKNGFFVDKDPSGIIIDIGVSPNHKISGKYARIVNITALGEDVEGFSIGDRVIVDSLKWTLGFDFKGEKYWATIPDHILAFVE